MPNAEPLMKTFRWPTPFPLLAIVLLLAGCATTAIALHPVNNPPPVVASVYRLQDVDRPPEAVQKDHPNFPRELRRAGVVGEVRLWLVVNTSGQAEHAMVIHATDERFAAAALESIPRWRFSPAIHDGKPVPCAIQLPFVFRLD